MNIKSWNPDETYTKGKVRRWMGEIWISLVDGNLKNNPANGAPNWKWTSEQDLWDAILESLL